MQPFPSHQNPERSQLDAVMTRDFTGTPAQWNEFVSRMPNSSIFHLWEWGEVIRKSLGHPTFHLAVYKGQELLGVLPLTHLTSRLFGKSLISMPFLNYGGVLGSNEAESSLYQFAIDLARNSNVDYLEFRHTFPSQTSHPVRLDKATFILPLAETVEATFNAFRKATRNRLRKVNEYGLRVERGNHLLEPFYHGFAIAMKEHGTPVLPKSFFEQVTSYFGSEAQFYIAYSGSSIAGCKLTLKWRDKMYQVWGGYPHTYRHSLANYLLSWEASKDAIEQGLKYCDFGRSTRNSGPAEFKRHFGCVEHQLYWEYPYLTAANPPTVNPSNKKYQTAIAIWKRLPLPLTKILGPQISPFLP